MKKFHPLLLTAISALLLFAAWPISPFTFLIFIAFIPLLWLERQTARRGRFFGLIYLAMLVWNVLTTWWICNSTVPAGIAAMVANALLMSLPWIGYFNVRRRMGTTYGYAALVLFWMTFEYIHLNWDLSWPWLTLGNVFATHPDWVQWYELTGTSGGSLWVLLVNILLFEGLRKYLGAPNARSGTGDTGIAGNGGITGITGTTSSDAAAPVTPRSRIMPRRELLAAALVLILPIIVSLILKPGAASLDQPDDPQTAAAYKANPPNIVVVQPNVDPWDEKFIAGNQEAQLQRLVRLSDSLIDPRTTLVVWPETAIPYQLNEDEMRSNRFIATVWDFLHKHPALNLLTGVEGFRFYTPNNRSATSYKLPEGDVYIDTYNSAVLFDSNSYQSYHKSKLVPGAEILPSFLNFMEPLFDKFGGTTHGYTRQDERTVLNTYNHSYHIAPAVCYESIYGEFMSRFVRNGADLLVIITNDGWWGNTAGYHQHESYGRLRAIETRRWVARSANTGISCFIDPSGKVIDAQPWDKQTAIKLAVPPNKHQTFYVQYGDILSKIALVLTGLLICLNILHIFKSRKRHGKSNPV